MSAAMPAKLTHVDAGGRLRMVNVSGKRVTRRTAVARGKVFMHRDTLRLLRGHGMPKGDVLAAAHLAAIQAAKRTWEIVPLAHPVPLEGVDVAFDLQDDSATVGIEVRVTARARTGVEMEALTAVSAAALAIYDMCKAVDRGMVLGEIALWEKRGGRRGVYRRQG
jgi:cyclic pyranopterin phosphate synthase